jgi:hypothetical protein
MATIINREGRKIHLWKNASGLHVSGHFPNGWRVRGKGSGWDLWDPPGGPCIVSGMRLGDLHEDFEGLIAGKITVEESGTVLVECKSS